MEPESEAADSNGHNSVVGPGKGNGNSTSPGKKTTSKASRDKKSGKLPKQATVSEYIKDEDEPATIGTSGKTARPPPKSASSTKATSSKTTKTSKATSAAARKAKAAAQQQSETQSSHDSPVYTAKVPTRRVKEVHEAPVQNIYGEIEMPSSCDQRLEQAIIFLSDEGPETDSNFKHKLRKLEHEFGVVWPRKKKQGEKDYDYSENLHRKVMAMMAVQRERVDAGARQWFEATMFPQYPVNESEEEREYPPASKPKVIEVEKNSKGKGKEAVRPQGQGSGATEDTTKDAGVGDTSMHDVGGRVMTEKELKEFAKNPWPMTLPADEIWHRRMPSTFPFGDTNLATFEMSKKISHDLGEDKEPLGAWLSRIMSKTYQFLTLNNSASAMTQRPWALPEVIPQALNVFMARHDQNVKELQRWTTAQDAAAKRNKRRVANVSQDGVGAGAGQNDGPAGHHHHHHHHGRGGGGGGLRVPVAKRSRAWNTLPPAAAAADGDVDMVDADG
ncbi:hypothetical protein AAFC00_004211 [Neodothiora populina]